MTRLLGDIGDTAIWVASIGIVIWVAQYTLLAKWWRSTIGVTMVGEALCILAIFIPTLMALAFPARYEHFAAARWYLYLSVGVVVASAVFILTRIFTWEYIRRQRGTRVLSPAAMAQRITELETEVAALRGETPEGTV